ncbi:MAG: phage tail protein [Clostridiales bacterium]|nr:phage tail protein [Clostridiales bacterium]
MTKTTVAESNVTPTSTAPGQIGYLGLVLIIVSSDQIKQLNSFNWDASVNYTEHIRHLKRPTLEMTSVNSDTISFKLTLSAYLGTTVMTDYNTLKDYLENGTAVPLKIGSTSYGNYRWIITALGFEGETTDGDGDWSVATVSVTLKSVEKTA